MRTMRDGLRCLILIGATACGDATEDMDTFLDSTELALEDYEACLDGIDDFDRRGPFNYTTRTSGAVKLWVPRLPNGCRVPIVHLANGTTARCSYYQDNLERLASHGFLAVCYESSNTGSGQQGIDAIETAIRLYPSSVSKKIGSTGHSQGGQAAIVTTQLAEARYGTDYTYAALAMEPASGYGNQPRGQSWQTSYRKVRSPVFMYSGLSTTGFANSWLLGIGPGDGLVGISWVEEGFRALSPSVEAYHWTAIGATHIPTPQGTQNEIQIAWFRWKLLGDRDACEYVKRLGRTSGWRVQQEQNVETCQ
ncbi:MAG: hypothetical protein ABW352_19435 [Polyangiales bacterium]